MGEKLVNVNKTFLQDKQKDKACVHVNIVKVEAVELDEMWSFVKKKDNQRWLWHAMDHETNQVLAYHIGPEKMKHFVCCKIN